MPVQATLQRSASVKFFGPSVAGGRGSASARAGASGVVGVDATAIQHWRRQSGVDSHGRGPSRAGRGYL